MQDREMDFVDKLKSLNRKTVSLSDLAELFNMSTLASDQLYTTVHELIDGKILIPVKSSGTNGNRSYPLALKYRIHTETSPNDEDQKQMESLHPLLLRSGYLRSHPEQYLKNKVILESLSGYLFTDRQETEISRKERSFEIFGKEKLLDDKHVQALLKGLKITDEDLKLYDTPEYCFHDFIPNRMDKMTLLICENKDIWFNIRRCMFEEGYRVIFGVSIDGVVYGNGNKVALRQGALKEYVKFMGDPEVTFLYWGDIDREGFEIYKRTVAFNSPLKISLFVPGYRMMLKKAMCRETEDSGSGKHGGRDYDPLFAGFTDEERARLNVYLMDNKLIPQEIITYIDLKEHCEKNIC